MSGKTMNESEEREEGRETQMANGAAVVTRLHSLKKKKKISKFKIENRNTEAL